MARYRPKGLGLERVLGVGALFSAAYGNVGSSIYYALGLVAAFALGMTPIVYLIAGVLFVMTAMTYAEAATNFPEAGGSSSFARRAFNELVSFIAAWGQMLNYIITVAISAFFVPHYLGVFWDPLRDEPRRHHRRHRDRRCCCRSSTSSACASRRASTSCSRWSTSRRSSCSCCSASSWCSTSRR